MLDPTPFQQFLAPRLRTTLGRLHGLIWKTLPGTVTVSQTTPTHEHRPVRDVSESEFRPVDAAALPMAWGRKFQQCWWKAELPASEGPRWLRWDDQGEATIYRPDKDGWTPHHGIDPGHREAPLPEGVDTIWIESICARTGIWVTGEQQQVSPEGSLFRGASVLERDDDAWHAWHDLEILLGVCGLLYRDALPRPYGPGGGGDRGGADGGGLFGLGGFRTPIESAPPLLRMLIDRLTTAVDAFERDGPAAMRKVTAKIFKEFPAESHSIKAILTGHAHIDLAWLWPERVGDFKAVHSFATADHLMGEYPEFHFGYSQPASYEAVGRRAPALLDRVKKLAKGGKAKWEATGAMYVESDTQLPCGEALVRAVELGQAGFRDLTGDDSKVLWLPDVFGYSAFLPQLLSGFGVPYFFTTKMHWSGATRFPHSAFRWQANDGESEVVGFIAWEHYNLQVSPREVDWAASNQRQSHVFPEALVPCGFGDGGGGVNATMCERARRLADLATMPRCEWGRIDGFFDRLAEKRDELPTWKGEMYLEYHRGVQTTHVGLKQAYRAAERGLQVLEAAHCVAGEANDDQTHHDWKRVCWSQFHDVLPGSSLQEAYAEAVPELNGIAHRTLASASNVLTSGETCVFNPVACERIEVIDGKPVRLPPLASVKVTDAEVVAAGPVASNDNTLDNGRVRATFDEAGEVIALAFDGHDVPLRGGACSLYFMPDFPANYDAWDIDRYTLSLGEACDGQATVEHTGDEARREVIVTRRVGKQSSVTLRYSLAAGDSALRVTAEVDWQDPQSLLKLAIPTDYRDADAIFGGPYGSTRRPQSGNTIADDARFEVPASRWATVGDPGGRGIALVTEATYGMGCRDGLLHASLVRSPVITEQGNDVPLRDFDAYGDDGHKPHHDIGRHTIRFALAASDVSAPRSEQPAQLADLLFTPVIRHGGEARNAGLLGIDGGDTLVAGWAKPAGASSAGFTLRLHETAGRRGVARLRLADGLVATRVNLRGEKVADMPDNAIQFKPHDLVSVRIARG